MKAHQNPPKISDSPSALVAIAYGAHRSGNTELRGTATRELKEQFGIAIRFVAKSEQVAR